MSAGVLTAALTETVIVTYRDLKQAPGLPLPSDYAAVAVVYGILSLAPDSAANAATLVAWGLVVATLLNLWNPGGKSLKTPAQASQGVTA